jgi:hypothetical protein
LAKVLDSGNDSENIIPRKQSIDRHSSRHGSSPWGWQLAVVMVMVETVMTMVDNSNDNEVAAAVMTSQWCR